MSIVSTVLYSSLAWSKMWGSSWSRFVYYLPFKSCFRFRFNAAILISGKTTHNEMCSIHTRTGALYNYQTFDRTIRTWQYVGISGNDRFRMIANNHFVVQHAISELPTATPTFATMPDWRAALSTVFKDLTLANDRWGSMCIRTVFLLCNVHFGITVQLGLLSIFYLSIPDSTYIPQCRRWQITGMQDISRQNLM